MVHAYIQINLIVRTNYIQFFVFVKCDQVFNFSKYFTNNIPFPLTINLTKPQDCEPQDRPSQFGVNNAA